MISDSSQMNEQDKKRKRDGELDKNDAGRPPQPKPVKKQRIN